MSEPLARDSIYKVIIGNPETKDIAYDFLPCYYPNLGKHVSVQVDQVYYDDVCLTLTAQDHFLLTQVDGKHSVASLIEAFARKFDLPIEEATSVVFARLKWARSLCLVIRENTFATADGIYIRMRSVTEGGEHHQTLYLPPFAFRVLELASGSYSLREIAQRLHDEAAETGKYSRMEVEKTEAAVADVLRFLIDYEIVAWIDDEQSREKRVTEFLHQSVVRTV